MKRALLKTVKGLLPKGAAEELLNFVKRGAQRSTIQCRIAIGRTQMAEELTLAPEVEVLRRSLGLATSDERAQFLAVELFGPAAKRALFRSTSIYEAYALQHSTLSQMLGLPAWAMTYPWDHKETPVKKARRYPSEIVANRLENGLKLTRAQAEHELSVPTVVSIHSHAVQYARLLDSIEKQGALLLEEPLPTAWVLTDGENIRWLMGGQGNHRARIHAALGMPSFFARVLGVVDIREASSWPLCQKGILHEQDALNIFERYFYARQFSAQ